MTPGLTHTRTRTNLFDGKLVGDLELAVDAIREDWEKREPYIDDPAVLSAGKARLDIAAGLVEVLKDPAE